tara:strand:+ start:189 stop:530 length:342 start_codon:yes stop_codon:yes gene_type:complete
MMSLHNNSFVAIIPVIYEDNFEEIPGNEIHIVPSKRAFLNGHPVPMCYNKPDAVVGRSQLLGLIAPEPNNLSDVQTMGLTVKLLSVLISGALVGLDSLSIVTAGSDRIANFHL